MENKIMCPSCDGVGYDLMLEHTLNCDGSCIHCPTQVEERCTVCGGAGWIIPFSNNLEID